MYEWYRNNIRITYTYPLLTTLICSKNHWHYSS
nr:MAG TPA: hypothetical protein [Caudoviricetes sp.]